MSSMAALQAANLYQRYLTLLNPTIANTVTTTVAASWVDIEIAIQHYDACEHMELPAAQLIAMGEQVGAQIQGTFIATLAKANREKTVSPWVFLSQFGRLWQRLFQGGAVSVWSKREREAVLEVSELSLVRFAYFRYAFIGVMHACFKIVGARFYNTRVLNTVNDNCTYQLTWK